MKTLVLLFFSILSIAHAQLTAGRLDLATNVVQAGEVRATVMSIQLRANGSDYRPTDIILTLGGADFSHPAAVYTKVFKTMYIVDDRENVLAKTDLNASTVSLVGNEYKLDISLAGSDYSVLDGATRTLKVEADIYSSIQMQYQGMYEIDLRPFDLTYADANGTVDYTGQPLVQYLFAADSGSAVPEPSSWAAIAGLGAIGLAVSKRYLRR